MEGINKWNKSTMISKNVQSIKTKSQVFDVSNKFQTGLQTFSRKQQLNFESLQTVSNNSPNSFQRVSHGWFQQPSRKLQTCFQNLSKSNVWYFWCVWCFCCFLDVFESVWALGYVGGLGICRFSFFHFFRVFEGFWKFEKESLRTSGEKLRRNSLRRTTSPEPIDKFLREIKKELIARGGQPAQSP